jgi:hypothetical protein
MDKKLQRSFQQTDGFCKVINSNTLVILVILTILISPEENFRKFSEKHPLSLDDITIYYF